METVNRGQEMKITIQMEGHAMRSEAIVMVEMAVYKVRAARVVPVMRELMVQPGHHLRAAQAVAAPAR